MANGEFPAVPPGGMLPPRPAPRGLRRPPVAAAGELGREESLPAAVRLVGGEASLLRPRIAELISALPIVSLEGPPTPGRPDLTPSPVPRVSLVPPTGQIDRSLLPLPFADEWRRVPTVSPRRQDAAPTPAGPIGLRAPVAVSPVVVPLVRPVGASAATVPPSSRLRRGSWVRDVRSSKREIALGLGIGLGLSVVVGRLGQAYLERRGAAAFAAAAPAASAPLGVATEGLRPAAAPTLVQAAHPAFPKTDTAPAVVGGLALAPAQANSSATELVIGASKPQATALALRAPLDRKVASSTHSTREGLTKSTAPRHPNADTPAGPDSAQVREPSGNAPLSPSQSAGLGLELPL